jgi:SAM-dependent methyltransferase
MNAPAGRSHRISPAPGTSALYDAIGHGYAAHRRPDARLAARIRAALGDVASVVNVGAGAGSYEPDDVPVVAVEPSRAMIAQRRSRARVVQARAEQLPFADGAFDAALAVLTVHHWRDRAVAFAECARVARCRVVVVTWDPGAAGFWLVDDYVPEVLDHDRRVFPPLGELAAAWGRIAVQTLPVPADCCDGFLGAYWRRPEAYLDPAVRAAMSTFARVPDAAARLAALRDDLASGAWHRRHGALLARAELDLGYRIVTAERS